MTFMVGLWGDDDDEEEEENEGGSGSGSDSDSEEEDEAWAPGPMARIPFTHPRLQWPRQLGKAGDWGLLRDKGPGVGTAPSVAAACEEGSGLVVLPNGAWRAILPPSGGAASFSSTEKKKGKGGKRGRGHDDDDDEEEEEEAGALMLFSPKTTYRFVLRDAGEVGEEMAALIMAAAEGGEEE